MNTKKEQRFADCIHSGFLEQQKQDEEKQLKAMHEKIKLDEERDIIDRCSRVQAIKNIKKALNVQVEEKMKQSVLEAKNDKYYAESVKMTVEAEEEKERQKDRKSVV